MYIDELEKKLKKLHFNPEKHNSINAALRELLDSEKYKKIMNGELLEKSVRAEVDEIIEIYNELKQYSREEIMQHYQNITLNNLLAEVYIVDNNTIVRKSKGKENYEIVNFKNNKNIYLISSFIIEYKNEENICKIETLLGEVICQFKISRLVLDQLEINVITDELIEIKYHQKSLAFCLLFSKKIINKKNCPYFEILKKILQCTTISEEEKNNLFKSILIKKEPTYLTITNIKEFRLFKNYIIIIDKNDEITYYSLTGEKIISSYDNIYSYIEIPGSNASTDEDIIIVGKYNNQLKEVYGYFDLFTRKEIVKPRFTNIKPWREEIGVVFDFQKIMVVDKKGNVFSSEEYTKSLFVTEKPECAYGDYDYDRKKMLEMFWNLFQGTYLLDSREKRPGILYVAKSAKLLKDNIYLVKYDKHNFLEFNSLFFKETYALVENLFASPTRITDFFSLETILNDNSELIVRKGGLYFNENYFRLFLNQEFLPLIGNYNNNYKRKHEPLFLEEKMKVMNDYVPVLLSSQNSSQLLELKDEKSSQVIEEYFQKGYISKPSEKIKITCDCKLENSNIKELFQKNKNKNNVMHFEAFNKNGEKSDLLINDCGKIIFLGEANYNSINFMDDVGNISISVPFNNTTRQILIDSDGNVLIPYAIKINKPINGLYVVQISTKSVVYDEFGNLITYEHDNIEWIKKYSIYENKITIDYKLLIIDKGYKRILDNNSEIVLDEERTNDEAVMKLALLRKELDNDSL